MMSQQVLLSRISLSMRSRLSSADTPFFTMVAARLSLAQLKCAS